LGGRKSARQNFNSSSDLRLFLLGNIGCGKTSSANTILNQPSSRSADDPKSCNLREAFTDGRRVALVEAPRWYWAGVKVDDSVRKETEQAVALMEPGPHAVLLLIPVNQFTEVGFSQQNTFCLRSAAVCTTSPMMHWVKVTASQCRMSLSLLNVLKPQRTHIKYRSSSVDGAAPQPSPVFSNPHSPIFISTPQPLSNLSPSASVCSPSFSSSPMPSASSSPELRLILLGRSGAGKSSVGNSILGKNVFRSESDSFTAVTQKCEKRKVAVVDTSDWFNSEQTPEEVRAQISSCVALSTPGPHAFLLCVPLDQPAKTELQALAAMEKVFGPDAVTKHTIVLFTYADRLRDSGMIGNGGVEAYIANQRGDLLKLVEKCRDRFQIMERGQREKKSVADLFTLVAVTMKEAGGQYFCSPAFLEAENKVKQKQLDLIRERKEKELDQKTVKKDQFLRLHTSQEWKFLLYVFRNILFFFRFLFCDTKRNPL
uniref:AIG1-type G domain-containing protein n=1 Tax=Oryzias latipes TaxID=8090 RepID=A0A3P9M2C9_ORYLA